MKPIRERRVNHRDDKPSSGSHPRPSGTTREEDAATPSDDLLGRFVSEIADYAILLLDADGFVTSWNAGAERITGYRAPEILGHHVSRLYTPGQGLDGACDRALRVAEEHGRFEEDCVRLRSDRSTFRANVVLTAIREPEGRLLGFGSILRELPIAAGVDAARVPDTDGIPSDSEDDGVRARSLEDDLQEARERAEEATRLKDEFLATVSHELRTPLHVMLGWGRLLQAGTLVGSKASRAVDMIVRNAVAQAQIIDDLLDVSRIVAGQMRLDLDLVDVSRVVRAAVEVVAPAAEAKGVALELELEDCAGMVRGDSARLQQVFWNLVSNGVKFTERGGSVAIRVHCEDQQIRIEVEDTGRGIAPEFLERVFDRFTQEEQTNMRRTGGLGLGLAIVRHLIEMHGGTVDVTSAGLGEGARFVVAIPVVAEGVRRKSEAARPDTADALVAPNLLGLSVVVLDDERDARELIQSILEKAGARVRVAANVPDGLALVRASPPDVVVSDIGMPVEDGYSFVRKLRALPHAEGGRIPVVALTAYARAEDRRKALLAGFQSHAAKPIDPQEFIVVLANVAGRFG